MNFTHLKMLSICPVPSCTQRRFIVAEIAKKNQTPPVIPENAKNLQYLGCFTGRIDQGTRTTVEKGMTPSYCVTYCATRSFSAAALKNGKDCHCSRADHNMNAVGEQECNQQCTGDNKLKCGGTSSHSLYDTGFKQGSINGKYIGCYVDPSVESRLMRGAHEEFKLRLNNRICQQFCKLKGYRFSGSQFGSQCFCSNVQPPHTSLTEDEDCNIHCAGSTEDMCGGSLRLTVYDTSDGGDVDPVKSLYEGCLPSSVFGNAPPISSNLMTTQYCVGFCYKRGYRLAGLISGNQCLCDNGIEKVPSVKDEYCNIPCRGNDLQKCGGRSNHINVYNTGIPDRTVNPNFSYKGCYFDANERLLNGARLKDAALTQQICAKFCFDRAYSLAGMENGNECYCGDSVPDLSKSNEHECNVPCGGDNGQKCGGPMRLSVYNSGLKEYRKAQEERCIQSVTTVKGEHTCKGKVILREEFTLRQLDTKLWQHSVIMPAAPDYPFVIYNSKPVNSFVNDGNFVIKPVLMNENDVQDGEIELRNCTGYFGSEECSRQAASYNILPPVESAMISTKDSFYFKYGQIEIRAKLPHGDWLVPALWLEPKFKTYGTYYSSGRMIVAMARGNSGLTCDKDEMGNTRLEAGIAAGIQEESFKKTFHWNAAEEWSQRYHTYTLTWTPDNLSFSVDGAQEKLLLSQGQKISDLFDTIKAKSAPWASGSKMAPFDQEFYISLGLYAGGMSDFRDDCLCRGDPKPWTNFAIKGMANFWSTKETWHKTWQDDSSSLKIDYVKVTAI